MCLSVKRCKRIRFAGGKDNDTRSVTNVSGVREQVGERKVQIGVLIQLDLWYLCSLLGCFVK